MVYTLAFIDLTGWSINVDDSRYYRVAQKMAQFLLNALTLSNINRISKFFHCQNQETFVIPLLLKIHDTSIVSLHYLVKCQ